MKLKDYGKNQTKRKEYIKQSGLLLAGLDVSKAKHDACIGTLEGVMSRIDLTRIGLEQDRAAAHPKVFLLLLRNFDFFCFRKTKE